MQLNLDTLKSLFKARILHHYQSLFSPKPVRLVGQTLYGACVAQARQPAFYLDYGIEDAIGARFELLTFHVGLVIFTLNAVKSGDPRHEQAHDTAQALFDAFLEALDNTLREQGTGDLAVPKKMKRLGQVIYTRMKAWDDLWTQGAGRAAEADYAARTLFAGAAYDGADLSEDAVGADIMRPALAFAAYTDAARAGLNVDAILQGRLDWCQIEALPEAQPA